ncbi:MAG: hypothetical protein Q8O67_31810 [Deltaproteobacteria bacterium]|nr:hypothetical protein [Deltaproteobacteria bacterium]
MIDETDGHDLERIRETLRSVLTEYLREPFLWLREADFQCALMERLTRALPQLLTIGGHLHYPGAPGAAVRSYAGSDGTSPHVHKTSRVHAEMRVLPEIGVGDPDSAHGENKGKADIIVFRAAATPRLVIDPSGAYNVIGSVYACDVLAIIELKYDPSYQAQARAAFNADIEKLSLSCLGADAWAPRGFFFCVDTSLRGENIAGQFKAEMPKAPVDWMLSTVGFRSAGRGLAAVMPGGSLESFDLELVNGGLAVRERVWRKHLGAISTAALAVRRVANGNRTEAPNMSQTMHIADLLERAEALVPEARRNALRSIAQMAEGGNLALFSPHLSASNWDAASVKEVEDARAALRALLDEMAGRNSSPPQ